MKYWDNITTEIQSTLKRRRLAKCAPTLAKQKAILKLYKYQCMAQGAFRFAKVFKKEAP